MEEFYRIKKEFNLRCARMTTLRKFIDKLENLRSQDLKYSRRLLMDQIRNDSELHYSLQAEEGKDVQTTCICKECYQHLTEKQLELYEAKLCYETPLDFFCSEECQQNYYEPDFPFSDY